MRARRRARRPQRRQAGAGAGQAWSGFGELELDRYEDVHILSRTLTEITSDFAEMHGQLERGLASLTDDSDSFDKLVSGIQSEVTRARMVTLEVLFTRLKLPVRDAATREGKEVRVATEGVDVRSRQDHRRRALSADAAPGAQRRGPRHRARRASREARQASPAPAPSP